MIDQLRQLAIFAKTVETGSFRGAAKALNLSPSVVSHHVAKLEDKLGVALLYRSTRKLSLTEAGEMLLASAQEMMAAAEKGLNDINSGSLEPTGRLKITAPAVLAHSALIDHIADFSSQYPKVDLDISFSDVRRDIVAEGIDLAIRMGWLKDSSLIAKKIAVEERVLVVSPAYMKGRRAPLTPDDLLNLQSVNLSGVERQFDFHDKSGRTASISTQATIIVDDAAALYRLVRAGAGMGAVPKFLAFNDLREGNIEPVLPEWQLKPLGIYAVWPPSKSRNSLTTRFVHFLKQRFEEKRVLV